MNDKRFEDLCLLVEQEGGSGVYPMGHLTKEQREAIKAAHTDDYKCGWNDRSMEQYDRERSLLRAAESGLNEDVRCLLASGCAFWEDGRVSLNMNDTWAWACSEIPVVPDDQVGEAARLFRKYGFAGLMYWYTLQPDGPTRSEFHDNNRAVEFVRHEEQILKDCRDAGKRAYYHKATYTIGVEAAASPVREEEESMRTIGRWIYQCLQHVLGIRSPSLGTVVPWPWAKTPALDLEGVLDVARRGK